jgi:hypothetical protein
VKILQQPCPLFYPVLTCLSAISLVGWHWWRGQVTLLSPNSDGDTGVASSVGHIDRQGLTKTGIGTDLAKPPVRGSTSDMDNWLISLHRIGRAICWVCGVLVAYKAFPHMDFVSFLLLGVLCGDCATLVFTLAFTYVWFHVAARSEAVEYELDEGGSKGIRTVANQAWLGAGLALLPEFAAGVLGAGLGFLIHSSFGWGIVGTLVVCIGVGAATEVLLTFVLPILALLIATKVERKNQ